MKVALAKLTLILALIAAGSACGSPQAQQAPSSSSVAPAAASPPPPRPLGGCTRELSPASSPARQSGAIKRVFVVVLENTSDQNALQQPFLSALAKKGVLLTNYSAITHPSQPNYLAMVAGDTFGVADDSPVTLSASHLGDLAEARGRTWKTYAETYPGGCFLGTEAGAAETGVYTRKHVPFLSFADVQSNKPRCDRVVVNACDLVSDIEHDTLPDIAFYVPNSNDDGHDTGVEYADRWLQTTFGPLLDDPRFISDTLFIVTFDEDDGSAGNHVSTILYGAGVKPGTTSATAYNHYSLLRTIEDLFGLGSLGLGDATATAFDGITAQRSVRRPTGP